MNQKIEIYDTTLRDGTQLEGISLSVEDKLNIIKQLDDFGVDYIEAGWPGANPKDDELFARLKTMPKLHNSKLVAFGSSRRANVKVEDDIVIKNLIEAGTDVVCIVVKTSKSHVEQALKTTAQEALLMISDSIEYLVKQDRQVLVDCEHFFDGFSEDKDFTMKCLETCVESGASHLVLCDTNGGTLPQIVGKITEEVVKRFPETKVGIHTHNDLGLADANALEAVRNGATQVQGTINGYGERTGNCNLITIIPSLSLKQDYETIPEVKLKQLTSLAYGVSEVANMPLNTQAPFVGKSAFTHKAGLHTSAIVKNKKLYEHVSPEDVGNTTRFVVSELAGASTLALKAKEFELDVKPDQLQDVVKKVKELEFQGYHFESAEASLYLLIKNAMGWTHDLFETESYRVIVDDLDTSKGVALSTEATVKLKVDGQRFISTCEGNGPVNAIDKAIRGCLREYYPQIDDIVLADYKVRVIKSNLGTGAWTRVLIDSTDGKNFWTTIGVSENIIEASWKALMDSIVYGLTL
jgi:2-isopropylmalate synthase